MQSEAGQHASLTTATIAVAIVLAAPVAMATPQYSIASAEACDTCHIAPIGWLNPGVFERACTLDCSGCHVSASGGGLRKPAGRYYGRQVLAMFGDRPANHGDPEQYREPGDQSTGGVFRLWRGFSGWKSGSGQTPVGTIDDRFGDIEPNARFTHGGDVRIMGYFPSGEGAADWSIFPMQADLYGSARLGEHLLGYGSVGLMGSGGRSLEERLKARGGVKNILALREVFIRADDFLPGETYVRAGRFNKPHGWRLPDHTSFIRRPQGFDQNSQAFGVEAGINPNFPWARVMLFRQGWSGWPGDTDDEANGIATTVGARFLPFTIGASFQALDRPKRNTDAADEVSYGFIWGLNAYPIVYLGEMDVRRITPNDGARPHTEMYAYHELSASVVRGVSAMIKYDWLDTNTRIADDHRHRYALGIEVNPYAYTQIQLQYRINELATSRGLRELLVITHVWF